MSFSSGDSKLLPRGRSTHGPTKTAWTTRYNHLLSRTDLTGRTRGRRHATLKRQPSCDSLLTGKHLKPAGVWRPYGPPLYGYGSALKPPRRKGPDTLVILAAIFFCLAALTAVAVAVLFKTYVSTC
uniref:Uncharacterized protein n=1 Tax=Branchiostoma floridae TaxID=7739 RepID=C3YZZ6_BRAFL|eukprot:XP_002598043.1 hypothetical protein BRAFLDRAFT_108615 [Branchiostoma floridae]